MKKCIFIIILNTLLFSSGSVYMSIDIQGAYDYHSDFLDIDTKNSFDRASIVLGYNKNVYQLEQFKLDLGCSFTISSSDKVLFLSPTEEDGNSQEHPTKTKFYSLYIMPNFQITDKINLWTNLGHTSLRTTYSNYTLKSGLTYGIGFNFKTTEHTGVGLGYSVYNAEADMSLYDDGLSNFTSAIINQKISRLSLDIFYFFKGKN